MTMADQKVRELVVNGNNPKSYILSAGAGAGKTSVLVDRISNLICNGVSPEKIVAITFTEKAASELNRRVRKKILKQLRDQPNSHNTMKQLRKMFTGTIHSFALRLLQRAPITSSIEPIPEIIEDETIEIRLKQAQKKWIKKHSDQIADAITNDFISRSNIYELLQSVSNLQNFKIRYRKQDITFQEVLDKIEKAKRDLISLQKNIRNKEDDLYERITHIVASLKKLEILENDTISTKIKKLYDFLNQIKYDEQAKKLKIAKMGSKSNWKKDISEIRTKVNDIIHSIAEIRAIYQSMEFAIWEELLLDFQSIFQNLLREYGEVRFEDIITNAIEITSKHFQHPYQYFHLDEAQDTDPRLFQLIQNLINFDKESSVLFIVGDINQSIYGFRNADIRVFNEKMTPLVQKLNKENAKQKLRTNFRSTPEIVKFVNLLFESVWEKDYEKMVASRLQDYDVQSKPIILFDLEDYPDNFNIDSAHQSTAELIAKYLDHCRNHHPKILPQNKDGTIAWSEIAVLFATTTHLQKYTEAFRKYNLPYVEEQSAGFFSNEIVQEVTNAIQVIANPMDGIALLATLRGIFFGVTDEAIWDWRNQVEKDENGLPQSETLYLREPNGQLDPKLRDALEILLELSRKKDKVSPFNLLRELYHKSGIYNYTYQKGDIALREKLNSMLTMMRRMENIPLSQIGEILRNSIQREERVKGIAASEEEAIRFLTVHSAKGLEFDWVVVVSAADKGSRDRSNTERILQNDDGTVELQLKDWFRTDNYQETKEEIKKRRIEENLRIMYVAMTRAKRKLLIPLITSKRNLKSNQDWIEKIKYAAEQVSYEKITENSVFKNESVSIPKIQYQDDESIIIPTKLITKQIQIYSVTELSKEKSPSYEYLKDTSSTSLPAAEIGILSHHLVQIAEPTDTQTQMENKLNAIAQRMGIALENDTKNKIITWISQWFQSDFYQTNQKGKFLFDYPITYSENDKRLLGSIDLLIEDQNQLIILDFKSNVEIEPYLEQYQHQVKIYCEAVKRALNKSVEGYLWHFPKAKLTKVYG